LTCIIQKALATKWVILMCSEALNNIANEIINLGKINFFDIFSLIISFGSLIFAILIPVRIAKKQDRISLFEKRLSVYFEIMKLVNFAEQLKEIEKSDSTYIDLAGAVAKADMVRKNFSLIFDCEQSNITTNFLIVINNNQSLVKSLVFLYSNKAKKNSSNISDDISKIYDSLISIMKSCCKNNKYIQDDITNYINYLNEFVSKYMEMIKEPLKM